MTARLNTNAEQVKANAEKRAKMRDSIKKMDKPQLVSLILSHYGLSERS